MQNSKQIRIIKLNTNVLSANAKTELQTHFNSTLGKVLTKVQEGISIELGKDSTQGMIIVLE